MKHFLLTIIIQNALLYNNEIDFFSPRLSLQVVTLDHFGEITSLSLSSPSESVAARSGSIVKQGKFNPTVSSRSNFSSNPDTKVRVTSRICFIVLAAPGFGFTSSLCPFGVQHELATLLTVVMITEKRPMTRTSPEIRSVKSI